VDVYWLHQNAAGVPPGDEWLSDSERRTLGRLRIPKRRADWRLGRWTAKRAISARLGLASEEVLPEIEVVAAASGAPQAVIAGLHGRLSMSLSHSGGVGLCALADSGAGLGCDVEKVEARSPAFLGDYFTLEEQAIVLERAAGERNWVVTLLWSAKESALKVLQCGLRSDLRSVAVSGLCLDGRTGAGWLPLEVCHGGERSFSGWWRRDDDFVSTVLASPAPVAPTSLDCVYGTVSAKIP
jgi:4'-phosphopantetheinyl transferase